MEKPKNMRKQEKQKMVIGIGGGGAGGGVGGVVVWGGVAAIVALVSVSAIRFRRKRPTNKSHHPLPPSHPPPLPIPSTDLSKELELSNNNDDQGKGLRVLLQDSSPPIDYHPSRDGKTEMPVTQVDSSSLAFTSSILDNGPVLDVSGQNKNPTYLEILLSDNSKPKSSPWVIDVTMQDYSLPVLDKPSLLKEGNFNENEPSENPLDVEVTEVKKIKEGKAIEAPHVEQFAEEDDCLQMQLNGTEQDEEEEGEEHADEDKIVEIGEEVIERARTNQFAVEGDLEVTEFMREVKAVEATHASQIEAEDNRQKHSIEEQEYDDAEIVVEKDEETFESAQKNQFPAEGEQEEIEVVNEDEAIKAPDSVQIEAEDNPPEEEQEYDGGNSVEKDEKAVEIVQMDQDPFDNDPQLTLSEEEEDNDEIDVDEDEEEIVEKGEESSEGTGDSSRESNAEAIWPAESIEELSLEFKELMMNNNQKLEEKIGEYTTIETEEQGCYNSIENDNNIYADGHHSNEETGKSRDSSNLSIRTWMGSSVLLILLLLALLPLLLSPTLIVKLCLTVFLVMILSRV